MLVRRVSAIQGKGVAEAKLLRETKGWKVTSSFRRHRRLYGEAASRGEPFSMHYWESRLTLTNSPSGDGPLGSLALGCTDWAWLMTRPSSQHETGWRSFLLCFVVGSNRTDPCLCPTTGWQVRAGVTEALPVSKKTGLCKIRTVTADVLTVRFSQLQLFMWKDEQGPFKMILK